MKLIIDNKNHPIVVLLYGCFFIYIIVEENHKILGIFFRFEKQLNLLELMRLLELILTVTL